MLKFRFSNTTSEDYYLVFKHGEPNLGTIYLNGSFSPRSSTKWNLDEIQELSHFLYILDWIVVDDGTVVNHTGKEII